MIFLFVEIPHKSIKKGTKNIFYKTASTQNAATYIRIDLQILRCNYPTCCQIKPHRQSTAFNSKNFTNQNHDQTGFSSRLHGRVWPCRLRPCPTTNKLFFKQKQTKQQFLNQ